MRSVFFVFATLLLLTACSDNNPKEEEIEVKEEGTVDLHSFANVKDIHTTHLHLDLRVNFGSKIIYGVARHEMSGHTCDTAIFDIKELEIKKVTLGKGDETSTDFVIGKYDSLLGQPLKVKITPDTKYINIYYQTTEKSEALDWLEPELTAGKKNPFLYTQGQAILTRSWIPCQDTPLNRITYSADVKVPKHLFALMSASNPKEKNDTGEYHFEMDQPIPSYLIALAVGDLVYTKFDKRCGVYSEPELAEACAYEFVDLPKMINAAEGMYGAYAWDQYDLIILPYSFPFGGMENPRLTFANPTIVAGDRSMVSVVAHELAHSWSGNLVTNATWNDFWLNEGFTVYFENRIMETIYGKEIADILAIVEYQDLEVALEDIAQSMYPEDTRLKLELNHRNPDEGMTDIAYVKGAFFLRTVEQMAGRNKFDAFLKAYFEKYAWQTVTTEDFVDYLKKNLLEPNDIDFNVDEWIYETGLPKNCVKITSERLENMKSMAEKINNNPSMASQVLSGIQRGDHITQEWLTFIRHLNDDSPVSTLRSIDQQLKFASESNPALKSAWYQLGVKAGYKDIRPDMKAYLLKIGRRWYIEGIYQELHDSGEDDLAWAKEVFDEAQHNYHFVSRATIEEILKD